VLKHSVQNYTLLGRSPEYLPEALVEGGTILENLLIEVSGMHESICESLPIQIKGQDKSAACEAEQT